MVNCVDSLVFEFHQWPVQVNAHETWMGMVSGWARVGGLTRQ